MIDRFTRAAFACVLSFTLAACGGGDSDTDEAAPPAEAADTEASSEATPASGAAPASPTTAPVTVAEIDSWQKGMAAELEAVRAAGTRFKEAKTADDTLSAMMGMQEMATQEAGAKAAGLDLERYKLVSCPPPSPTSRRSSAASIRPCFRPRSGTSCGRGTRLS